MLVLASVFVTSCDEPAETQTYNFDTVVKAVQSSIVDEFTPDFEIVTKWTSNTQMKVDFTVPGEADFRIEWDIDSKFDVEKNNSESAIDLEISWQAEWEEFSWELKGMLSMVENTLYWKLEKLNLVSPSEEEQLEEFNAMIVMYLDKWFSVTLWEEDLQMLGLNTQEALMWLKEFGDTFAETPVLKLVSENENDKFYDYEVTLNVENAFKLMKQYYEIFGYDVPESLKMDMEQSMKFIEVKANLKVSKTDLSAFMITIRHETEPGKIEIWNSKDEFLLKFDEEDWDVENNFELKIDKTDEKEWLLWKFLIGQWGEMIELFNFVYKLDRLETKVWLNMDLNNVVPMAEGESGVFDMMFYTKIKPGSVIIEAPEWVEDLTPMIAPFLEQMRMMREMSFQDPTYDYNYEDDYNYNYDDSELENNLNMWEELTPEEMEQLEQMMEDMEK